MATAYSIDIESLLQPVSDESPTGPDVREDSSPTSPYQTIKQERNQARAAERQSIHDGDNTEATTHWRKIWEIAPQILAESKDLEVASWYAEAMIRKSGFAGLRDAFALIHGFIENFWENLHPMPDEYGIETRVSCLAGLNGEGAEGVLIAPIRKVELTLSDPGPFSLWQYHQALDIQKIEDPQAKQNKISSIGFSIEAIEKSVESTENEFFVNLRDDLAESIELYKKAGIMLDEHCGIHEAPPTRTITEVLDECLGVVKHIAKHKFPSIVESNEEAEGGEQATEETEATEGATVVVKKGPVANREDAFRQLAEIAEYFRKTEPHSPISYVLQKAIKWGDMPLNQLIAELITEPASRAHFTNLTGVEIEE